MTNDMSTFERPGIAFEKLVAAMQAQIDPTSTVTHNEVIIDRLGHHRQFDVVIRGRFAGQPMLGVIECKDLKRKVGNPEVDAFVTKARDVNANFKVLMSRSGFAKPALEKCADYGIQALSLLERDVANKQFLICTRWTADVRRWGGLNVWLNFCDDVAPVTDLIVEELKIRGKRVLDSITNFLLKHEDVMSGETEIVQMISRFERPQLIEIKPGLQRLCESIVFRAERVTRQLEYRVEIKADGFFDWNSREVTVPPNKVIATEHVPTDFSLWEPRSDGTWKTANFIEMHLEISERWFEFVEDAIDLDAL
jgi:urease gamma subunit